MRRKTFEVLFEPAQGMAELVKNPCLWRSGYYFTLSLGLFTGVITNSWLLDQELAVRLAMVIAGVIIGATALALYGFLLHGIMETFGALAGNPNGLICLLGYTALPFLVLTPAAFLTSKMGLEGLSLLLLVVLLASLWTLYLLVRSLEAVYLIDFKRAAIAVLFSLLMLYIVFLLPWQLLGTLVVYRL